MASDSGSIYYDLARALGVPQQKLADLLGISRRTVQRLDKDLVRLSGDGLRRAAVAVFPKDPELAATLAFRGSTTLEKLGLVHPASPPKPAAGPQPSPPKPTSISPAAADSVVCAAADAMNLPPRTLRPVLLAAFNRAHALGLSVEAVKAWLDRGDEPPDGDKS